LVCCSWVDVDEVEDAIVAQRKPFSCFAVKGAYATLGYV